MSGICQSCKRPLDNDEHRGFFFKAISVAYENWPENHEFQPETKDHLRAWLLIEAKQSRTADFIGDLVITKKNIAAMAELWDIPINHMRFGRLADGLRVLAPISMKKLMLSKKQFDAAALAVYPIIEAAIGVGVERLVREKDSAVK